MSKKKESKESQTGMENTSNNNDIQQKKERLQQIAQATYLISESASNEITQQKSATKGEAFKTFCKEYSEAQNLDDNKKMLALKYKAAKHYVNLVNEARDRLCMCLNYKNSFPANLKQSIEALRKEQAMSSIMNNNSDDGNEQEKQEEKQLKQDIEMEKKKYKEAFEPLQKIKKETDMLETIVRKQQKQLEIDFEKWYKLTNQENNSEIIPQTIKSAWETHVSYYNTPVQNSNLPSDVIITGNTETDDQVKKFYHLTEELHNMSEQ